MNILASLGRGLGGWLGLSGSLSPAASLAPGEQLPGPVHFITAQPAPAAPVATAPGTLRVGNPPELDDLIRSIGVVRKAMKSTASAPAGKPLRPAGKSISPQIDDDDLPPPKKSDDDASENDSSVDSIYEQLTNILQILKNKIKPSPGEDAQEKAAAALFRLGKKRTAAKIISHLGKGLCERALAEEKLLSPQARMAASISEQPIVAALSAALRPRVAPVASKVTPTDPVARLREITAEQAVLDKAQRQCFSNEVHAKHLALAREKSALLGKLHAR
jgi:hypothetical protein